MDFTPKSCQMAYDDGSGDLTCDSGSSGSTLLRRNGQNWGAGRDWGSYGGDFHFGQLSFEALYPRLGDFLQIPLINYSSVDWIKYLQGGSTILPPKTLFCTFATANGRTEVKNCYLTEEIGSTGFYLISNLPLLHFYEICEIALYFFW